MVWAWSGEQEIAAAVAAASIRMVVVASLARSGVALRGTRLHYFKAVFQPWAR
jgi:hypothetical protein